MSRFISDISKSVLNRPRADWSPDISPTGIYYIRSPYLESLELVSFFFLILLIVLSLIFLVVFFSPSYIYYFPYTIYCSFICVWWLTTTKRTVYVTEIELVFLLVAYHIDVNPDLKWFWLLFVIPCHMSIENIRSW